HIVRVNPKGKRRIDIRPYLLEIRIEGDRLLMTVKVTNEGTARPEEVLRLLGLPDLPPGLSWRITKTSSFFRTPTPAGPAPHRRRPRFGR
ncbi:MAG: hypothetical protein RDV41_15235, partial [Planctomycetota bacterium]|nr:hypothetical protein [Planctomycetota bacterium]